MRKGEEKRQELLNAAEKLFCQRGYEATSVQDILDARQLSKGGFYHHFASKEDVLRAVCVRRAEQAALDTAGLLKAAVTPMGRINAVLRGFMPLRGEEAGFAAMLLPVLGKPEGRAIAMLYQEARREFFLPLLRTEMTAAAAAEVICPPVKEMEPVILYTVDHCWLEAADCIRNSLAEGRPVELPALLGALEKHRRAVEVLMDAPYGSVEIVRMEDVAELVQQVCTYAK